MKRYRLVIIALLCACSLALGACGGTSGSSSAASASAEAPASDVPAASQAESEATPVDPAEKFIGSWDLAAFKFNGITATGNLSAFLGEAESNIDVSADGTGSLHFAGSDAAFNWTQAGEDAISLEFVDLPDSSAIKQGVDVVYDDGVLSMHMEDEEQAGDLLFGKGGVIEGLGPISTESAVDITSEDQLVGTWKLAGMGMDGASVYGDSETLNEMMGDSFDSTMAFDADGTVEAFGSQANWAVEADGAVVDDGSYKMPVKALGDDIVFDMGAVFGSDMVLLYSR